MAKKWVVPAWMRRTLKKLGPFADFDEERLVDLVNDDGTNSNVFNNAPRALICVAAKSEVDMLTRLYEAGLLEDSRKNRKHGKKAT